MIIIEYLNFKDKRSNILLTDHNNLLKFAKCLLNFEVYQFTYHIKLSTSSTKELYCNDCLFLCSLFISENK